MIKSLLEKQKIAFENGETLPLEARRDRLLRLKRLILEHEQEISRALRTDLGKSEMESISSEIGMVLKEIDHILKNLKGWMKPTRVATPLLLAPSRSRIYHQPYGQILIFSPFNYPFLLAFSPLAGAIAGGNTVILKPSELTTAIETLMTNLIRTYFKEEEIAVVTGGPDVSAQLLAEKFDFIFFTGSTRVGKMVMLAAAQHLTPVCLELGGKSPAVIDRTADLDQAARKIVWGKFYNAGQTCVAPDFVYVHAADKEVLVRHMKKWILRFYSENPRGSGDFGRIVNTSHFDRLQSILDRSEVIYGGERDRPSLFISPSLIAAEDFSAPAMEEEIFGPLLPILTYTSHSEVLKNLRTLSRPLSFYLFAQDTNLERYYLDNYAFGGGCVNDCLIHLSNPYLPFGGIGSSGMGGYHGAYSFDLFTHKKSVVRSPARFDWPLRYPPSHPIFLKTIRKILGLPTNS